MQRLNTLNKELSLIKQAQRMIVGNCRRTNFLGCKVTINKIILQEKCPCLYFL